MSHPLEGFIRALRACDVPVSVREATEAYRTVEIVGYGERRFLKDALGIVMAKTHDEKLSFEACFDLYFARAELADTAEAAEARRQAEGEAAETLADRLLAGDSAALAQTMEAAGTAVGVQEIRFFTQRGYFTRRILDAMGLREMEERIQALREAGDQGSLGVAEALEKGRAYLLGEARAYVERQHEIFARPASQRLREEFLERTRLSALDERDYARMHNLVRRMAKRLAAKHSLHKRRRRRGQLDVRRTLRANMGRDGIPFEVIWRRRKIDRPSVIAICDVSRSVAAAARFLLLFLHSLNELLRDMRAFAFSDSLIEVTDVLDEQGIDDAIKTIMRDIGYRSTDYGQAFADFKASHLAAIDRKTTVIILGDGRSNMTEPRADILETIYRRARRVIWLNPEPKTFWGTGDSEMPRFRPYCHLATHCSTVKDLERVIDDLLTVSA